MTTWFNTSAPGDESADQVLAGIARALRDRDPKLTQAQAVLKASSDPEFVAKNREETTTGMIRASRFLPATWRIGGCGSDVQRPQRKGSAPYCTGSRRGLGARGSGAIDDADSVHRIRPRRHGRGAEHALERDRHMPAPARTKATPMASGQCTIPSYGGVTIEEFDPMPLPGVGRRSL